MSSLTLKQNSWYSKKKNPLKNERVTIGFFFQTPDLLWARPPEAFNSQLFHHLTKCTVFTKTNSPYYFSFPFFCARKKWNCTSAPQGQAERGASNLSSPCKWVDVHKQVAGLFLREARSLPRALLLPCRNAQHLHDKRRSLALGPLPRLTRTVTVPHIQ